MGRIIEARYAGTCKECGGRFAAGARIRWAKGQGSTHKTCPATPTKATTPKAAAADHCLAAAYRGECPGVDPDALMVWRIETRAAFQGRPSSEILADIEQAREALRKAPIIDLGGNAVRDLRDRAVPELPEAAMREGVAYLTAVVDRDGRTKIVLGGHTTPETVRAFLADWAPAQGLVDLYGDPARGFAGGYLPQHDEEAATA